MITVRFLTMRCSESRFGIRIVVAIDAPPAFVPQRDYGAAGRGRRR